LDDDLDENKSDKKWSLKYIYNTIINNKVFDNSTFDKNLKQKYCYWVILCFLISTSLYFDYVCSGYVIIPPGYNYPRYQPLNLADVGSYGTNYLCKTNADCNYHGVCNLEMDVFRNVTGSRRDCANNCSWIVWY
jgi:hypothetical protein